MKPAFPDWIGNNILHIYIAIYQQNAATFVMHVFILKCQWKDITYEVEAW